MIIFALLTIGAVLVSAGAGLWLLRREYLPLLRELARSQAGREPEDLWGEEERK